MATAAAGLVKPGGVIAVSGGTTAFAVAEGLRHIPGLTVVTNSLPAADLLRGRAESWAPTGCPSARASWATAGATPWAAPSRTPSTSGSP
ncbi:hypothetical protein [Streptomyces sp. bgisy082]|uniref:hypothetical protein n=1 Tax=Streptomyces sp. bgisy082 TaxID=3413776 RepID=UPI003D71F198